MTEKQEILIVDDKKENLVALRRVLSGVDAEIVEATSGNKALAATLDHQFAVTILDVQMPAMNGYELAEHLRGDQKTQGIPIVFLTAEYSDERHMFRGYEAGGVDYITKPFAPQVLLGKVKVYLEMDRSRRELEMHRDHLEALVAERTAELEERIKELRCLYAISSLVAEPSGSINESLKAAVDLIPPGWQYSNIARARILFEGKEFASAGFRDTAWKQSADIMLSGETVGTVEVCYLEERPALDEGPFLKEERDLISEFAKQLGVGIERKRAAEEIRTLNRELEARVEQRTAELRAANNELEAFSYSVSHDLRAPLRHISGFSSLLAERAGDSLDEKSRHCVDTISRSVREMGVLIDDLLQFSRTGRAELQITDVDMEQALSEALLPLQRENEGRAIEWSIGALPHVIGDHALLRQVWANLLDNAVKYSRDRAPARIEVGARDGDGANEDVFWVRDNGVGFDMQYAHKLFGVFQRLHSSTEFEGTGIGLANVQRIINRLGGRVWAEAELDNGATFSFALPRRKESPS